MPELAAVLTQDTTWTFTMPGRGVLGPVAGRGAVLDLICDGHTAQTGRVRHHLGDVVVTTMDAATAEVRAHLVWVRRWVVDRRAHPDAGQHLLGQGWVVSCGSPR
ncbi:nuclear transport factor 2 family protein [Streptomyces sp. NBC_00273]|uniref:nuclear transport factor 2 family protein n=1 Tax=Streptomyces sp. NBC_00273 TaxID=2903644 RepID=UPI002E2BE2F0|nr:nuclear transport factor 2 family protein [Streptomyces sp. NBC_00273]